MSTQLPETAQALTTAQGETVTVGEFVQFLVPIECAVAGPYRFEGFREGRPYFSIAGIDFAVTAVSAANLEKLDWDEWQRPDFHLDRFLRFFYARQNPTHDLPL